MIVSIPQVCSRCKRDHRPYGAVRMWCCLSCQEPICCGTAAECQRQTCQACQDDPTRSKAFQAGVQAGFERERRFWDAFMGKEPAESESFEVPHGDTL